MTYTICPFKVLRLYLRRKKGSLKGSRKIITTRDRKMTFGETQAQLRHSPYADNLRLAKVYRFTSKFFISQHFANLLLQHPYLITFTIPAISSENIHQNR